MRKNFLLILSITIFIFIGAITFSQNAYSLAECYCGHELIGNLCADVGDEHEGTTFWFGSCSHYYHRGACIALWYVYCIDKTDGNRYEKSVRTESYDCFDCDQNNW